MVEVITMAVRINGSKLQTTYSMLTTDTKPATANDGDTLEVLNDATSEVVEIWRYHSTKWYKY
jgi:hypothetical protein